MHGGWLLIMIALTGCKERRADPAPDEKALDPAIAQAATSRLELVRRSVAAVPPATASLPACQPGAGVKVLSRSNADVLTGGKGDPGVPGWARPNGDTREFDDLSSKWASTVSRAVKHVEGMQRLALFVTDEIKPPVAGTAVLISPATVKGRVVVFDLNAKPTCMSSLSVTGGEITSVYVKKTARSDEVQRMVEYQAEKDLTERLNREVAVLVKSAEN